ncbi:MAG: hypothetical protein M3495_19475 [Pseudomonadota bacterium]|nr:hypothetical protein [Gammaproteobacteria bacterium]MDQ3583643.1 hypothetical protein [Pseudomonadota bacterium]
MSQLLVRDLAPETLERLKEQAKQQGRSLQAEVKRILEQVVKFSAGVVGRTFLPERVRNLLRHDRVRIQGKG